MMTSPLSRATDRFAAQEPDKFQTKDPSPALRRCATVTSLIAAVCFSSSVALAAGYTETDLVANKNPLVDANGIRHVPTNPVDPNLVNPWGVGESSTSPFWISDNGMGLSTLYLTDGTKLGLKVSIPAPGADPFGSDGAPTGVVFNTASASGAFMVFGCSAGGSPAHAPATFLFATEDGTIVGWNGAVGPKATDGSCPGFVGTNTHAIIAFTQADAVYKGLAIGTAMVGPGSSPTTVPVLYATNFHNGTVDVFDGSFGTPSNLPAGAFADPGLPKGYAPFNIVPVGGRLFVTYAVQDADAHDDVAGQGHGIVDTFTPEGKMLARFAQHGQLDSPWGVAPAPASFGEAAGKLLIGNFGNGHINIFDPTTGEFLDKLRNTHGQALVIDGLWTIMFGNGVNGGKSTLLYFTAGPNDESDGLFGSIAPGE
jgi:uncharacterized protein (TIGR03118 family)